MISNNEERRNKYMPRGSPYQRSIRSTSRKDNPIEQTNFPNSRNNKPGMHEE
jgi:hypothetical protein